MMPHAPGDGIWAVVPVKRFDRAKARLADVLGQAGRAALAKAMLGDVLEQLARTEGFAGTAVVTCDAEAAAIAEAFGAKVIADPLESGTNDAVLRGIRAVGVAGGSGVVVVPGDLPCVTSDELRAIRIALARSPVVIVPATRDGGTNILALSPAGVMTPAFGCDSFARHLAATAAIGVRPVTLVLDGAGHDIDTVADLVFDARLRAGARTRACLRRFEVTTPTVPADLREKAWPQ